MPLRRVEARSANALAVGILVPPGTRTYVVVRPRGMSWDLLPVRWDGDAKGPPVFASFDRDEAATIARRLAKSLEERDLAGQCPLETLGHEPAFQVWLREAEFNWLLCERVPNQPYRPLVFTTLAAAQAAAELLLPFVHPGPGRVQDYYFNTQNFS
jgi:hypothetical protein